MQLYKGYARNIAHAVKERDVNAYWIMARSLIPYVKENDVIIPAPNHEGCAVYTLAVAKIIQEKTGCKISDCLGVFPHKPLYNDKKQELRIYLKDCVGYESPNIYLLDNVIATGKTFISARKLIPDLKILPYAYTKDSLPILLKNRQGEL